MKEKKRFKSIRASMILMVLALITSCIVGGTYAKYVTSGTGSDQARIAKFGVVIVGNGTAFSKTYDSKNEMGTVKSVLSTDSVIAPGTSGKMISMSVSGNPEVSVAVTYKGEFSIYNWEVMDEEVSKFYCPLIIIVNGREIKGTSFENEHEFQEAVNTAIEECSGTYHVESFSSSGLKETIQVPSVEWRWDFDGGDINDKYDTYLGNRACEASEGVPNNKIATVCLSITTTITQVD